MILQKVLDGKGLAIYYKHGQHSSNLCTAVFGFIQRVGLYKYDETVEELEEEHGEVAYFGINDWEWVSADVRMMTIFADEQITLTAIYTEHQLEQAIEKIAHDQPIQDAPRFVVTSYVGYHYIQKKVNFQRAIVRKEKIAGAEYTETEEIHRLLEIGKKIGCGFYELIDREQFKRMTMAPTHKWLRTYCDNIR